MLPRDVLCALRPATRLQSRRIQPHKRARRLHFHHIPILPHEGRIPSLRHHHHRPNFRDHIQASYLCQHGWQKLLEYYLYNPPLQIQQGTTTLQLVELEMANRPNWFLPYHATVLLDLPVNHAPQSKEEGQLNLQSYSPRLYILSSLYCE